MTDDVPAPGPDRQRLALAWRAAPASVAFVLRIREISRRENDLIDSLLFATVVSANLAPVSRDTHLQLAYAAIDEPAPPDLRRPVSMNAVAQSMRIPFETARRRILRMARRGVVEITPRGVVIPTSITSDPDFMRAVIERHEEVGRFHGTMRRLGVLPDILPAPVGVQHTGPPVRITNRLCWEYVLRMVDELMALTGDPLSALLLLQIVRRNTDGFSQAELAAWAQDPAARAIPVRTVAFARSLGLSAETARRYVMGLEASGFCRRSSKGVVAVLPPDQAPALERMVLDNLANVQRMFARLAQLGALDSFGLTAPPATARSGASS